MSDQPSLSPVFGSRVKKNGERIEIRGDCNYLRNKTGEVTGLVTVVADITDLKRAEEELAKSKAILTAAVECLPFDFFALDPDGRCILQNAVSRRYYGDALGKTTEDVCPDPRNLARWLEKNQRAFAGERVEGDVELAIRGEQRHVHNIITPIRDGDEVLESLVSTWTLRIESGPKRHCKRPMTNWNGGSRSGLRNWQRPTKNLRLFRQVCRGIGAGIQHGRSRRPSYLPESSIVSNAGRGEAGSLDRPALVNLLFGGIQSPGKAGDRACLDARRLLAG